MQISFIIQTIDFSKKKKKKKLKKCEPNNK